MLRCCFSLLLLLPAAHAANSSTELAGFVTRVASPLDFDIDGVRITLTPTTALAWSDRNKTTPLTTITPFLGQFANAAGKVDTQTLTIEASRIVLFAPQPVTVSGSAIIDLILPASAPDRRLRADGRTLEISATVLEHPVALAPGAAPPVTFADLHTNVWIDYHGQRRADGVVTIDQASFVPNQVLNSEGKLLKKSDYDPAAIPDDTHQSGTSKFFVGTKYKMIPPDHDDAKQARINRIGQSLIPAFQTALPADDPTRIHFRFQLVDEPKWHDAITMPSGVILVPRQIVERLTDDAQLAAVLADNIATALEKQTWRQQPVARSLTTGYVAGQVTGLFIPGVGIATALATYKAGKVMLSHAEQQSGRVALCLMHDAGYDLAQAPEAWWILATKPGKVPHHNAPPQRAINQFEELGTTWQPHPTATIPDPLLKRD